MIGYSPSAALTKVTITHLRRSGTHAAVPARLRPCPTPRLVSKVTELPVDLGLSPDVQRLLYCGQHGQRAGTIVTGGSHLAGAPLAAGVITGGVLR
jgi:hypothetical protein